MDCFDGELQSGHFFEFIMRASLGCATPNGIESGLMEWIDGQGGGGTMALSYTCLAQDARNLVLWQEFYLTLAWV